MPLQKALGPSTSSQPNPDRALGTFSETRLPSKYTAVQKLRGMSSVRALSSVAHWLFGHFAMSKCKPRQQYKPARKTLVCAIPAQPRPLDIHMILSMFLLHKNQPASQSDSYGAVSLIEPLEFWFCRLRTAAKKLEDERPSPSRRCRTKKRSRAARHSSPGLKLL